MDIGLTCRVDSMERRVLPAREHRCAGIHSVSGLMSGVHLLQQLSECLAFLRAIWSHSWWACGACGMPLCGHMALSLRGYVFCRTFSTKNEMVGYVTDRERDPESQEARECARHRGCSVEYADAKLCDCREPVTQTSNMRRT